MDFPFKTDGCSAGMSTAWRLLFGHPPPWEGHCVAHDERYWAGGTAAARRHADAILFADMARMGHPVWARIMWLAVRAGGHPLLPFPWRWGYGWKFPASYGRFVEDGSLKARSDQAAVGPK